MFWILPTIVTSEIRDAPNLGFHQYELPPHTVLAIENPEVRYRMAMFWSGDADDDPSVVIGCTLWGMVYLHHPVLVNSAFPVGELVRFKSDGRVQVQLWVFPIDFCAPTTFFYSAESSLSDEFRLTESFVNGLCLFFDNPSLKNRVIAQIKSKRVDYSISRVEVINTQLDRLDCQKNRCLREIKGRFFVRFVGAKVGLKLMIETEFQKNEAFGRCSRNAIPVWDGNLSYAGTFPTADEEFICDEPVRLARKKWKHWIWIGCGICLMGCVISFPYCHWIRRQNREDWIPKQLQEGGRSRAIRFI
jgi:hypothetical protein